MDVLSLFHISLILVKFSHLLVHLLQLISLQVLYLMFLLISLNTNIWVLFQQISFLFDAFLILVELSRLWV